MPSDLRKISCLAVALLVVLRISIGWHLFYEGMWKLSSRNTATPWTAEGYLKNSSGPLRKTFREMTGDPNDLKWLDYDAMSAKWDAWRDRFIKHYGIDQQQLDRLLDGPDTGFSVSVPAMPPDFNFDEVARSAGVAKDAIKYDAKSKRLIVDPKLHVLPSEQAKLLDVISDSTRKIADPTLFEKLIKAINDVAKQSSRLSFRERLAAMLKGDPERVGDTQKSIMGDIEFYKNEIVRYEDNYAKAKTKFQWDHLERQWIDLQQKRRSLVGPVQALQKDLFEDANKILSAEQLAKGPVPDAITEMSQINFRTMWGLTIFGLLLMLGFFTRISAMGGAALLTLFYMAMPPWPGLPEATSVEHNLIVNKVLVEMLALLAIAAMPTGKWFGIDAIISAVIRRLRKTDQNKTSPA